MPENSSANPTAAAATTVLKERYELGERLADGAFFNSFRGRDTHTGRAVAIKVLKPEYASDEVFTARLLSEAQCAMQLRHPNIMQVFDAWRERGTVVLVTEWVRGINLKERVKRVAPFPLAVSVDIFLACAEALAYAHEQGCVHGDIRPDNIIITPDGRVKVTDFGIGVSVAASTRIQLSALPQAAFYMAPELAEGKMPDAGSDLYSLACILYEMLSGVVPYDADTPIAVAVKHLHEPVPSLKQANPAVPNAVNGLVAKSMQKSPADRYPDVQAMLQDGHAIRDALRNDRPLTWSPMPVETPAAEPDGKKVRRRPPPEPEPDGGPSFKLLAALGGLMLAMIVGMFLIMNAYLGSAPKEVRVPMGLVGKTQGQAEEMLRQWGLVPKVNEEFDDRIPAGQVIRTDPIGGTEIRAGREVTLAVSKGAAPVAVPNVTDKTAEEARQDLEDAGLTVRRVTDEYSDLYQKGKVISQDPVAGTQTKRGSGVNLIVSLGPPPPPAYEDVPVEPETPDTTEPEPGAEPGAGTGEIREQQVAIDVPSRPNVPQRVRITVRHPDNTEETVYEEIHQPGAHVEHTVPVESLRPGSELRIYVNDRLIPPATYRND
ncbi:MAG: protein kinase domain-containing protein [Armatimonadota bacterium]